MAGAINKLLDFFGWESQAENEEDMYDDTMVEEAAPVAETSRSTPKSRPQGKVVPIGVPTDRKVIIRSPQNILEMKELVDHLRARSTVIMNVEKTEPMLAQRMVDFLSGAVYCIDGDMEKLSSGVIIAVPNGVDITADLRDDVRNKGTFSWVK